MRRYRTFGLLAFRAAAFVAVGVACIGVGLGRSALADDSAMAARETVDVLSDIFGKHAGYRPVHAKGIVVRGKFEASPQASSVTRAAHMSGDPVPVIVRFSDFAGIPTVHSSQGPASPRGMAVKFLISDQSDTDIVAHSYDGFPVGNVGDFLEFLRAVAEGPGEKGLPSALDRFAADHPSARRFLDTPKPAPESYATEAYYGGTAFAFVDAAGGRRYVRYRIVPERGTRYLSAAEAERASADYLREELPGRLSQEPARFDVLVQLAEPGDAVTDSSVPWGDDREVVDLGTLTLDTVAADSEALERQLSFVPLNLVDGIESSGDPLLVARTRAYFEARLRRRGSAAD